MPLFSIVYSIKPLQAKAALDVEATSIEAAELQVRERISLDSEFLWTIGSNTYEESVIPVLNFEISKGSGSIYNTVINSVSSSPVAYLTVQAEDEISAVDNAKSIPYAFTWNGLNLGQMLGYDYSISVSPYSFVANLSITLNTPGSLSVGVLSPTGVVSGSIVVSSLVPDILYPTPPPPYPIVDSGTVLLRFGEESVSCAVSNGQFNSPPFIPKNAGSFPLLVSYSGFVRDGINYLTGFATGSLSVSPGTVSIIEFGISGFSNSSPATLSRSASYIAYFKPVASQFYAGQFTISVVDSASSTFSVGSAIAYYNNTTSTLIKTLSTMATGPAELRITHLANEDFSSSVTAFPINIV